MRKVIKDVFSKLIFNILHEIHNYLPILPERMKIEKVKKLVPNLLEKTEYVVHITNLKKELNHGLALKKFIE